MIVNVLIFVFLICLPPTYGEEPTCPTGWYQFRSKCYYYYREPMAYGQAIDNCESNYYGSLLTIRDKEEQNFVAHLLFHTIRVYDHVWIGARGSKSPADDKNNVTWFDGSPLVFAEWAPGEPQFDAKNSGTKYCVIIWALFDHRGKWYAYRCNIEFASICQRNLVKDQPETVVEEDIKPSDSNVKVTTKYVNLNWIFVGLIGVFLICLIVMCYFGNFSRIGNVFRK